MVWFYKGSLEENKIKMSGIGGKFYLESFFDRHLYLYRIEEFIYSGKTKFQKVDIVKLSFFGKSVFLDKKIQSTQCDEFIYHESLVHPSILLHENPETIYIAGGGEGATLREVLKHGGIKKVRMCDIDEEFVRICKKYLPEWHQGAFEDKRVELVYLDARKDVESLSDNSFDIYISDLTEPIEGGPSTFLFTKEYFEILNKKLREKGICVFQAGSTIIYYYDFILSLYKTLKEIFPSVFVYEIFVSSFHMSWGFVIAIKEKMDIKEVLERFDLKKDSKVYRNLKFLTPHYIKKIFILPKYLESSLESKGRVLADKNPFIWERDV